MMGSLIELTAVVSKDYGIFVRDEKIRRRIQIIRVVILGGTPLTLTNYKFEKLQLKDKFVGCNGKNCIHTIFVVNLCCS